MDPPDADGEIFWIVEIDVESGFPGYPKHGHPTVQFIAGTKAEHWINPPDRDELEPPIYRYGVEVDFRTASQVSRDINLRVVRCWDAQERACKLNTNSNHYYPIPSNAAYFGSPLQAGVWRAIITGEVRDKVGVYEQLWKNISPFLLQMSQAPEMRKLEEIYLGSLMSHEELHTDTGSYDESLEEVMVKDKKVLRPFLRMPPPKVVKIKHPIEHSELHTDNSESEYDA